MNLAELNKVANAMVVPGKGILAADGSSRRGAPGSGRQRSRDGER